MQMCNALPLRKPLFYHDNTSSGKIPEYNTQITVTARNTHFLTFLLYCKTVMYAVPFRNAPCARIITRPQSIKLKNTKSNKPQCTIIVSNRSKSQGFLPLESTISTGFLQRFCTRKLKIDGFLLRQQC